MQLSHFTTLKKRIIFNFTVFFSAFLIPFSFIVCSQYNIWIPKTQLFGYILKKKMLKRILSYVLPTHLLIHFKLSKSSILIALHVWNVNYTFQTHLLISMYAQYHKHFCLIFFVTP